MKAVKFSKFNNGLIPLYGCDSEHLSKSDMSGTYYKSEDVEELVEAAQIMLGSMNINDTPDPKSVQGLRDEIQKFENKK